MSYYPGQKPFTHPDLELKDPNKIAQQQEVLNAVQSGYQNIHHIEKKEPINTENKSNLGFKPDPNWNKCKGSGNITGKNERCQDCLKKCKESQKIQQA